ncbi:MAG: RNA methyltransferase, partial [Magnetovibrio sp.]|nr:RNA methyltransferase [Magnetovibrio sp.]
MTTRNTTSNTTSNTSTKFRRPAKSKATDEQQACPAIILVEPQMAENIGMVARAMLNCGLTDLRLVSPREKWPNARASKTASGADVVIDNAKVFACTSDAIADLTQVYATTARARDMTKDVFTPRGAAEHMHDYISQGTPCGVLFGREAVGLHNDDVALADCLLNVPLNPAFSSLNLAQAVLLLGYEWYQSTVDRPTLVNQVRLDTRRATKDEVLGLFQHLETELDACGFLGYADKRPKMVRNLRNMFNRADLTEQEVR